MKILLTSIGTRGDIEPFIAHGQILEEKGHKVFYAFPAQFSKLVPSHNQFYPLSPKIIELIHGEKGRTVMGNARLIAKIKALWYLYKEGQKVNKDISIEHLEAIDQINPDVIVSNPKCSVPTLWTLKTGKPHIWLSPVPYVMHYVKNHAHLGFGSDYGSIINKLTYKLANFGLTKNIKGATKHLPKDYSFSSSKIRKAILKSRMIFAVSPALCPKQKYWPSHVEVTGYKKTKDNCKQPLSDEVIAFINRHEKVLFLTFGSMLSQDPKGISELIYEALVETRIPAIVNTAAGGLIALEKFKQHPDFLFTKTIDYNAIFPKISAVVHHGGSGTTHTALMHARPSIIVPHVIDQFQWNRILHKKGVGPLGPSINKLEKSEFKSKLLDMLSNDRYRKAAKKLANQMNDGTQYVDIIS